MSLEGDAQGRAATNPVAALPCATPRRALTPPRGGLAYPSRKARLSLAGVGEPSRSAAVAPAGHGGCAFGVVRRGSDAGSRPPVPHLAGARRGPSGRDPASWG